MKVYPPSIQAIIAFRTGQEDGLQKIVQTYLMRAAFLSAGFWLFSDRETAVKNGFLGSAIIESYLLYFYSKEWAQQRLTQ